MVQLQVEERVQRTFVLEGLCHAFASARYADEAFTSATHWVRTALGVASAPVLVATPDARGRLRIVWRDGQDPPLSRARSARRRRAFDSKTASRLDLSTSAEGGVAFFPLVSRGASFGVLEIVARSGVLQEAGETLSAVASQLAIVLSNLSERDGLLREVGTLERAATLERRLLSAARPEAALGIAARFLWRAFHVPVGIWWAHDPTTVASAFAGVGTRTRRDELERQQELAFLWPSFTPDQRVAIQRWFEETVGSTDVMVVDAGDAVVFIGGRAPEIRRSVQRLGSTLQAVLPLLVSAIREEGRDARMDLGLAWTAHELRGPLTGVKAALEVLLEQSGDREGRMLRLCLRDVDQLIDDTEGILWWAAGSRQLEQRPVDVVELVKEAVDSCGLEEGRGVIGVVAPEPVTALVDPLQLRAAVANLVRNAVAYSDRGASVTVRVDLEGTRVRVSVRDHGPGVPDAIRESIFEPFVRAETGSRHSRGTGLGLFITRRVVEAHGGKVWVDPGQPGATFQMLLPAEGRERTRSAS